MPHSTTLRVIRGHAGWHLVTTDVIEEAEEAQKRADATPRLTDYGELRRSGDVEELAERLGRDFGIGLDVYAAAIERSAGREKSGTTDAERLAALTDVVFLGDDDCPADSDGFRSEHELANEIDDHYLFTIEQGMVTSVPADVLDAFGSRWSPTFGEGDFAVVEDERLDEMIAVLQARGYTVIRD